MMLDIDLSRHKPDFHTVEKGAISWFALSYWNLPGSRRLRFLTSRNASDRNLQTIISVCRLEKDEESSAVFEKFIGGNGPDSDLWIPVGRRHAPRLTEALVREAHAAAIADYFDTVIPRIEQQYGEAMKAAC